jgi:hypothetical protein
VTRRSAVREFEFDSPVLGVGAAGSLVSARWRLSLSLISSASVS